MDVDIVKGVKRMNKKNGFTLVELLAIISILGVVMILVLPTVLDVFFKTKNLLDDNTKKTIVDSAKMYLTDIDLGTISYKTPVAITANGKAYAKGSVVSPYDMKVYLIEHGLVITMKDLYENKYYMEDGCDYKNKPEDCKAPVGCSIKLSLEAQKVQGGKYYQTTEYVATLVNGCE